MLRGDSPFVEKNHLYGTIAYKKSKVQSMDSDGRGLHKGKKILC